MGFGLVLFDAKTRTGLLNPQCMALYLVRVPLTQEYVNMSDEGSRFAFVLTLRCKDQAAPKLQELIMQLDRTCKRVHTLHTDQGREFTSSSFDAWKRSQGVQHVLTPADSPQNNGMIERFHGTLMPRARAVIHTRRTRKDPRIQFPFVPMHTSLVLHTVSSHAAAITPRASGAHAPR